MLIPEAVQLVLHAAVQAESGALHVLEMGHQISVAEKARNLIRLSGFGPGEEIGIEFTGVRPGEKLFEELVAEDEQAGPSGIEGIHRVQRQTRFDRDELRRLVDETAAAAVAGDDAQVLALLKSTVPTYTGPTSSN